jgi:hypothetical protein
VLDFLIGPSGGDYDRIPNRSYPETSLDKQVGKLGYSNVDLPLIYLALAVLKLTTERPIGSNCQRTNVGCARVDQRARQPRGCDIVGRTACSGRSYFLVGSVATALPWGAPSAENTAKKQQIRSMIVI